MTDGAKLRRRHGFFIGANQVVDDTRVGVDGKPLLGWQGKLVYLVLLRHVSNGDRTAFPSRATIALKAGGISVDTVDRGIRQLETAGYLTHEKRHREDTKRRKSNLYVLDDLPQVFEPVAPEDLSEDPSEELSETRNCHTTPESQAAHSGLGSQKPSRPHNRELNSSPREELEGDSSPKLPPSRSALECAPAGGCSEPTPCTPHEPKPESFLAPVDIMGEFRKRQTEATKARTCLVCGYVSPPSSRERCGYCGNLHAGRDHNQEELEEARRRWKEWTKAPDPAHESWLDPAPRETAAVTA